MTASTTAEKIDLLDRALGNLRRVHSAEIRKAAGNAEREEGLRKVVDAIESYRARLVRYAVTVNDREALSRIPAADIEDAGLSIAKASIGRLQKAGRTSAGSLAIRKA